jgi:hypothetical protein
MQIASWFAPFNAHLEHKIFETCEQEKKIALDCPSMSNYTTTCIFNRTIIIHANAAKMQCMFKLH